ncbi:MAG TPA: BadF/BadG/BcrA/BcrD ATPase family protein [Terracidiphilus sp.]|nr:BadF/BadG/BcrA/BcrD ATPase family protein [Terracidiphilus sp.]
MNVVMGIDGGGTRTRASIVAGDRILAFAENGSIKRLRVGAQAAEENLRDLLEEVYRQAGLKEIAAASVGLASSTMPGVSEWINAVFEDFHVKRSEIVGDEVIALDAAFRGGPGILQIAGTGSNTIGRAPGGERERAGGWSSRLGDDGSGYWIGLHAVRRALRAYDREEPTRILETVGRIWGTPTMDEFINVGDGTPGPDFAMLAPAISQLAEEGDPVAAGLLQQAAADLVESVLLVRAKLRRKHGLTQEVPVAWIGSVIGKARLVREAFFEGLHKAAPEMPVGEREVAGIDGAIWRAQRLAEAGRLGSGRQADVPPARN